MENKIGKREEKKVRARREILNAAALLFKEKGFNNTSVSNIMVAADLGVGTFYNYFESKEEVLTNLIKELFRDIEAEVEKGRTENKNSLELLQIACAVTAKIIDENRFVLPLLESAVKHSENPDRMPPNSSPGFKEIFDEIIKAGRERGEIRRDVPPELISEMFHSIYQAAAYSKIKISFGENIRLKAKILTDGIEVKS